jgi:hypothetical protein
MSIRDALWLKGMAHHAEDVFELEEKAASRATATALESDGELRNPRRVHVSGYFGTRYFYGARGRIEPKATVICLRPSVVLELRA